MKKMMKFMVMCMLVMTTFTLSPVLAEGPDLPGEDIVEVQPMPYDITSIEVVQDQEEVHSYVQFSDEGEVAKYRFPEISLYYQNESDENESYTVRLSEYDLTGQANGKYEFSTSINFAQEVQGYGTYVLDQVKVSIYNEQGDQLFDQAYNNSEGIWSADAPLALLKEYNEMEQITEADLQVELVEKQNFAPYLTTQFVRLIDLRTEEMIAPISVSHSIDTLLKDVPASGSGSKTVHVDYEIAITANTTRTITLPTTVAWYGAPEGTALCFDDEHIPEYALAYNEKNEMNTLLDYYVRLNDGSVIKERGSFFMGGEHFESEAGVPYVSGGTDLLVSLKYLIEEPDPMLSDFNVLHFRYRYYFVDHAGNLVNEKGEVVVPFAQRKNVSYLSVKDGISLSSLEGALPSHTTLHADTKNLDAVFEDQNYVAYDITLIANYETVQPVGSVAVGVKLPEELKGKEVVVYYVAEDGAKEEIEVVSLKEEEVVFTADHFSTYSIVERSDETKSDQTTTKPNDQSVDAPNTGDHSDQEIWLIVSGGCVVVLAAGIWLKKKQTD